MTPIDKIYRFIWSHTTGKPFTYVLSEYAKEHSTRFAIVCMFIGLGIGNFLPRNLYLSVFGSLIVGFIAGHIFWCNHIHKEIEKSN